MRKWRLIQNPKLTSPLVPLSGRRIFLSVADVPQPDAALPGPAPRLFAFMTQVPHLDLAMVSLNPEEDIVTLARKRCPKTHRPRLLPAQAPPAIAEDPIHPGHLRPLRREIRPPRLKNIVAPLGTAVGFAIRPPTVVQLASPTRVPRALPRRGTTIGTKIGANNEQGLPFFALFPRHS